MSAAPLLDPVSLTAALRLAEAAAREAGAVLRARDPAATRVRAEAAHDLKLEADVLAERVILGRLRQDSPFPILSEEAGAGDGLNRSETFWVVDPLDGTVNYGRRLPLTCVSVGLWQGTRPQVGVIFDFERDELFAGAPGHGATCNGQPIGCSEIDHPRSAVFATGFPSGSRHDDEALLGFCRQVQQFKKVRLLGSAALSLAWLAAGRLDAYGENDIWFWDVAAGLALVSAAGGQFSCTPGDRPWQHRVRAWAPRLAWGESGASAPASTALTPSHA